MYRTLDSYANSTIHNTIELHIPITILALEHLQHKLCYNLSILSAFPQLFDYSIFAVTGLRLVFGLWFLTYGYSTLFKKGSQEANKLPSFEKIVYSIALVSGLFTFIGLFTQISILVGLFILLLNWYIEVKSKTPNKQIFAFGLYIAIIGLALLFLGPGAFAIDLPL